MIDDSELYRYFDEIIEAKSNPFSISKKEVYKQNEEIKIKFINEDITLVEVQSFLDPILNNKHIEEVDYYPKTFFKKLFNIKSKINLNFEGDSSDFVMMSNSTKKIFKTNCTVYNIEEDNKIIIGKRSRLIYQIKEEKIFIDINRENFRTILIK